MPPPITRGSGARAGMVGRGDAGKGDRAYPPLGSRALGRRSLLPQRRHRLAFQALRELQSMQIFFTSVLASASGKRAIGSPAEREREMPYLTLTAPGPDAGTSTGR